VLGRDVPDMLNRLGLVFDRLHQANPLDQGDMILDTDTSDVDIGAVLYQMQQGRERVLAYGSCALSKTEQNYCTTRRELLAVVEFTSHFRQYLLWQPFPILQPSVISTCSVSWTLMSTRWCRVQWG